MGSAGVPCRSHLEGDASTSAFENMGDRRVFVHGDMGVEMSNEVHGGV